MSGPDHEPKPRFDDWPVRDRDTENIEYVGYAGGTAAVGTVPMFYDPEENTVFKGSLDEDAREIIPDRESEWDVHPEETLGEALDRLGEELNWDSLSEFAQEHLESDESS